MNSSVAPTFELVPPTLCAHGDQSCLRSYLAGLVPGFSWEVGDALQKLQLLRTAGRHGSAVIRRNGDLFA
jgi:hypothetical protein